MSRSTAVGLAAATLFLVLRVLTATEASAGPWDARPFESPTDGVDRALLLHDGQTYAAIAQDPTLGDASRFYGDTKDQAYRAARPMLSWLAWLGSAGRPSIVPEVLLVLSILSVGAMAAAAASLVGTLGGDPSKAMTVLLLPGALCTMLFVGLPDALGTAGVLAGLSFWLAGRHRWAAATLAAAMLTRETAIVAVAALVIAEPRRARLLLWTPVPLAAWIVLVRVRVGAWAFSAGPAGAHYALPFEGWWRAARHGGVVWWLVFVITIAVAALGFRRLPGALRWFVGMWGAVAVTLGWQVWWKPYDFPRVLLPATVVAMAALLVRPCEPEVEPA